MTALALIFHDTQKGTKEGIEEEIGIDDPHRTMRFLRTEKNSSLRKSNCWMGQVQSLTRKQVSAGKLSPVFFGSALTNFGVETFLRHFLKMTTSPLPRMADCGLVDPMEEDFSAFVFKIQANMNKNHRDRIAFMRICSGKFEASRKSTMYRGTRKCVCPSLSR